MAINFTGTTPGTLNLPDLTGPPTTGTAGVLTFTSGAINVLGGLGITALQNKGADIAGRYAVELAKIENLRTSNVASYNLAKAKLDATYGAEEATLKAKGKRQMIALVIGGVLALAAIVIGGIFLFRRT